MFKNTLIALTFCASVGCQKAPQEKTAVRQPEQPKTATPEKVDPPATVAATLTPAALFVAYGNNPAKADLDYKGKWIELIDVSGPVEPIGGTYRIGSPVITETLQGPTYPPGVWMYFDKDQGPAVSKIEPWSRTKAATKKYRILGFCKGRQPSEEAWRGYVVNLESCIVSGEDKVPTKANVDPPKNKPQPKAKPKNKGQN